MCISLFEFGHYSAQSWEEAELWQVRASQLDSCHGRSECEGSSVTSRGRSDWWGAGTVGVQPTHKHAHTGGVTHTPAWVVSSPWKPVIDPLSYVARESENINDGEEAAVEDGKRWHSG